MNQRHPIRLIHLAGACSLGRAMIRPWGLGDPGAAEHALERALDVAEPDGVLLGFLLHPAPGRA